MIDLISNKSALPVLLDFQSALPNPPTCSRWLFSYYKNMEILGGLPITLNGQTFDKKTIKAQRRVLEIKTRELADRYPEVPFYPLLESNPGQARLIFPENRFRMTNNAMEFINADANVIDTRLTEMYTHALEKKGFVFPARSVNGKFTVLKPLTKACLLWITILMCFMSSG